MGVLIMASTKIEICEMALGILAAGGTLQNIDDPQTTYERVFAKYYDTIKHKTMRYALKHTAIVRTTLLRDDNAPQDFTYKSKWKIPNDCVKFLGVGGIPDAWKNNYVLEGGYICPSWPAENQTELDVRYVRDVDESEMPADFVLLLAHELAAFVGIARQLTDNNDVLALAKAALIEYRREYKKNNAEEILPTVINESSVRHYSNFGQRSGKR